MAFEISKVKAPKKESTAEVITEEMAPPPGELRRRFSEDSISSEASISSDSSSKVCVILYLSSCFLKYISNAEIFLSIVVCR